MIDIETRSIDQLPEATAVSPDALVAVQEPGGPATQLKMRQLLGRLISTEEATEQEADLQALLDYDANTIGLVFADPDPAKNGWYRKTNGPGVGPWVQFEQLSSYAAAQVAALLDAASAGLAAQVALAESFADAAAASADALTTIVDTRTYYEDAPVVVTGPDGTGFFGSVNSEGAYSAKGGSSISGERLDMMIDQDGFPTSHLMNPQYIREFPRKRQQLLNGDAVLLRVVMAPADSYTRRFGRMELLSRLWKAEMGNGGFGWCGCGFEPGNPGSPQGNIDPAEISVALAGPWTGHFTTEPDSPDLCAASSSTGGAKVTFTYAGTDNLATVSLRHIGNIEARYRWSGGDWIVLSEESETGAMVELSGVPAGNWTLEIEVVSGTVKLAGINGLRTRGVVAHNLAVSGSGQINWAHLFQLPTNWRLRLAQAIASLGGVDTWLPQIGANDQGQNYSHDLYRQGLITFHDDVMRTINAGCDILWNCQPENGLPQTDRPWDMKGYAKQVKKEASIRKFAVLDMQKLFGADYSEYGHEGTHRVLFDGDREHPNAAGNSIIRDALDNALKFRS